MSAFEVIALIGIWLSAGIHIYIFIKSLISYIERTTREKAKKEIMKDFVKFIKNHQEDEPNNPCEGCESEGECDIEDAAISLESKTGIPKSLILKDHERPKKEEPEQPKT